MEIIVLAMIGLLALTFPKSSPVHPGVLALAADSSASGLECRPSAGPDSVLDSSPAGRGANFAVSGSYNCHRPVFSSDERDVFTERLLHAETGKAKRVAPDIQAKLVANRIKEPLRLEISGAVDAPTSGKLAALYRNELTQVLGSGRVSRLLYSNEAVEAGAPRPSVVLKINVVRVDIPDLMTQVRLVKLTEKGESLWAEF